MSRTTLVGNIWVFYCQLIYTTINPCGSARGSATTSSRPLIYTDIYYIIAVIIIIIIIITVIIIPWFTTLPRPKGSRADHPLAALLSWQLDSKSTSYRYFSYKLGYVSINQNPHQLILYHHHLPQVARPDASRSYERANATSRRNISAYSSIRIRSLETFQELLCMTSAN
ncbi:hypothetical protein F4810DRAFT_97296 [Camillea tinctor]|nr:hypothetical protein F4810DRAFT_97296 [Camillea tinctor]